METDLKANAPQDENTSKEPFDFGLWPSLIGLIACLLIIWFMFHYANGSY